MNNLEILYYIYMHNIIRLHVIYRNIDAILQTVSHALYLIYIIICYLENFIIRQRILISQKTNLFMVLQHIAESFETTFLFQGFAVYITYWHPSSKKD